ncbi:MAG: ParB/RepB/Spo0J family partition protein [Caldimicrobium sp.]|nr:ParB/RepB/Spo0J family partition protein [Caldimicrobium sp.]MCX7612908.1 ParB/RepB/Spo0J family partition protein [Caldimicrobium sp.]MDW8094676.1 ParB/RepB/Spo0J family partition protein [Caldimicrobium sp.]
MALKIKKKVLGKGLEELIPELTSIDSSLEEKGTKTYLELPVEQVTFFSYQPRITFKEDESFQELMRSIQEKGILQPIVVRKITEGLYECVAGERRLRAAKKLGLKTVPVIVKKLSDEEALLISIMENLQRKDLNPMEIALAYKNLTEKFGYTQEEIAEKVGKDRTTVANFLRLLNLPPEIQEDILKERLTVGHAKALLSLPSAELQLQAKNLILQKNLSVRETEKLVEVLKRGSTPQPKRSVDEDLKALSDEVSKLLGITVEVKMRGKRPTFLLYFDSIESAEIFIERLKRSI